MARDIGLGMEAPKGECSDKNCPWHGTLPVRGRVFECEVVSNKMKSSVIVRWDYYLNVPKYERSERRRSKVSAHNPSCIDAKKGDKVVIAECRPLSKTKKFVVVKKL